MTRSMISGIIIIIMIGIFFTGCFDNNNDKDDGFNIQNTEITGPYLNVLDDDQIFIGGARINNEFHHIYIDEPNYVMKFNNETWESEELLSDQHVMGAQLGGNDLYVYHGHETNGGVSYMHELTHVNAETGEQTGLFNNEIYGPGRYDPQFMLVAAEEDRGVALFELPNADSNEWNFVLRSESGSPKLIERDVPIEDALGGDVDRNGNIVAFIDQSHNLVIYKLNESGDYERVFELNQVKHISFCEDKVAIVDKDGLKLSTFYDPSNLTFVEGTDGAQEVDIYENFSLLTKDDGIYLFHREDFVKFYNKIISNIWLYEQLDVSLLRACGTFSGNGDDTGHFDIKLNL